MTTVEKDAARKNPVRDREAFSSLWYAVYTRPRHEKSIAKQLSQRCIESFLPLYGSVQRWKDRKKLVWLPLFPGYVFVRMSWHNRLAILQLPGVVRFVSFGGSPAEVPEAELQALRAAVEAGARIEPHRYLNEGRRVRVYRGPLQDTEGVLVRKKGTHRLVLSIDLIQRSVAVEVDASDVTPILGAGHSILEGIQGFHSSMQAGVSSG
jgi:transcription antitermination factor NusG